MDTDTVALGKAIKKVREKRGMSQASFAKRLGVTQGYISKVEAGKTMPNFKFIHKVRSKYSLNINKLCE